MNVESKIYKSIKYFYYFISLSVFVCYGYFYYTKKYKHNGLNSAHNV